MKLTKEKVCLWTFSEGILKHKTTLVESLTGLLSDTGSTPVASTMKTLDNTFLYCRGFHGGGEGYRTPVRKQTSLTFYERSYVTKNSVLSSLTNKLLIP